MKKKIKGLWLFGFSGSGKSYISKKIHEIVKNSIIIDGDDVRKKISFDLSYTKTDRIIQTQRLFGISQILISNKLFPIVSSSYLGKDIFNQAKKINFLIIKVTRKKALLRKRVFKLKTNVVGKDIKLPNFKCMEIKNDTQIKKKIEKVISFII